jgi:hypothetical protein
MISQPSPISGVDIPRWSQLAWEGILNKDISLSNYENENKK